jgi:hypothetical protein
MRLSKIEPPSRPTWLRIYPRSPRDKAWLVQLQKAAPFGAAFPLSADRGLSSGDSPQSEGRVHQACRERRETMRHSTTSFPLLNSKREMGACL